MKRFQFLGACLAALCLAGCVIPSLNPFFGAGDVVAYPAAEGAWTQDDGKQTWNFVADGKGYRVTQKDDKGREALFKAVFGRIGENTFIDFSIDDPKFNDRINDIATVHMLAAHSVGKVTKDGDTLVFMPLDYDWMRDQVKANPKLIPHVIQDDRPVLTATTAELQAFLRRFGSDTNAFKNSITLKKRK